MGWLDKYQNGGNIAPKRKGTRKNSDGTESSHLMRAEKINDSTWVGFPSLFQNEDGSWDDWSNRSNWEDIYQEAKRRGEVKNFGKDSISAIKYGEGSWKPKAQKGISERTQATKVVENTNVKKPTILSQTDLLKIVEKNKRIAEANRPMLSEISKEEYDKKAREAELIQNTNLGFLEAWPIYAANPLKMVGDITQEFVDNSGGFLTKNPLPTTEEDRIKINENRFLGDKSTYEIVRDKAGMFMTDYAPDIAINYLAGDFTGINKGINDLAQGAVKNIVTRPKISSELRKFAGHYGIDDVAKLSAKEMELLDSLEKISREMQLGGTYNDVYKKLIDLNIPDDLVKAYTGLEKSEIHRLLSDAKFTTAEGATKFDRARAPYPRIIQNEFTMQPNAAPSKISEVFKKIDDSRYGKPLTPITNKAKDFLRSLGDQVNDITNPSFSSIPGGEYPDQVLGALFRDGAGSDRKAMQKVMNAMEEAKRKANYRKGNNRDTYITGSTDTSHDSYLLQMNTLFKELDKYGGEMYSLGYKPMNSFGFLSKLGNIPERKIVDFINTKLSQKIDMGKLPYNVKPALYNLGEDIGWGSKAKIPHYAIKYSDEGLEQWAKTRKPIEDVTSTFRDPTSRNTTINMDDIDIEDILSRHSNMIRQNRERSSQALRDILNRQGDVNSIADDLRRADEAGAFDIYTRSTPTSSSSNPRKIVPPSSGNQDPFQKGGIIEDEKGQWVYPGEITRIPSNRITMKGVKYPVLGISDKGDKQIMFPEGEYTFKGKKVTEIPLNKAGGWLEKYNK